MSDRLSGRALAAALNVDEKAVRKAVEIGRIKRGSDGKFDLAEAREQWVRSTEPNRTKVRRRSADPQSAPAKVRTPSAPRPQADLDVLWQVVATLPSLAAWDVALKGGGLQLAYDLAADLALDIGGDLRLRGYAEPPIAFEEVDWASLAEEAGLTPIDPTNMAADYARRHAEG